MDVQSDIDSGHSGLITYGKSSLLYTKLYNNSNQNMGQFVYWNIKTKHNSNNNTLYMN